MKYIHNNNDNDVIQTNNFFLWTNQLIEDDVNCTVK